MGMAGISACAIGVIPHGMAVGRFGIIIAGIGAQFSHSHPSLSSYTVKSG